MSEQPVIAGAISGASLPCASQCSLSHFTGAIRSQHSPGDSPMQPSVTQIWALTAHSSRHWLSCAGWPQWRGLSSCGCLSGHASISPLLEEEEHTQRKDSPTQGAFFSHLAFHLQVWLSPHSTNQYLMRNQTQQMWRKLWNEYKAMILTLRKSTLTILWYFLLSTLLS